MVFKYHIFISLFLLIYFLRWKNKPLDAPPTLPYKLLNFGP